MIDIEDKKELLRAVGNVLIFPFIPQPSPNNGAPPVTDTIDAIAYHYIAQLSLVFSRYGFDVNSETYNKGINVVYNLLCATLYKTNNYEHELADQIDELFDALRENGDRGDLVVSFGEEPDEEDGDEIA
jgi:hypothetical protein